MTYYADDADDYYDDDDRYWEAEDDAEANRACANGHEWASGVRPARIHADPDCCYPEEETCPDCPTCGEPGYTSVSEAREADGWAACIECGDYCTPPAGVNETPRVHGDCGAGH